MWFIQIKGSEIYNKGIRRNTAHKIVFSECCVAMKKRCQWTAKCTIVKVNSADLSICIKNYVEYNNA